MGLFGRKNKKEKELDKSFEKVTSELNKIDNWDNPKKLERFILDSCEQIIAATKDIKHQNDELNKVEFYLNDVERLSNLKGERRNEMAQCAANIIEISKAKDAYDASNFNLTLDQYTMIAEEEDDVPFTIKRMQENEVYQAKAKKEMNSLEGDKIAWDMERKDIISNQKILKRVSILLLLAFASLLVLSFVLEFMAGVDVTWLRLITFGICGFSALFILLYFSNSSADYKKATRQMNKVIEVLNISRMKYANVTKAIDYVCDKYGVSNSYELNYIWEQYSESVRQKAKYEKNSDDLEYFTGRLYRILSKLDLHDPKLWLSLPKALVDPNEMAEVKHKLIVRRKKIKVRIEENTKAVKSERDEIDNLMEEHHYYVPEIMEIIKSVDKICGLNK